MQLIEFSGTKVPVTPADLTAVEQTYNFALPEDYKQHLLHFNGGWPTRRDTFVQVNAAGGRTERSIADFYSVKHGVNLLEESIESLRGDLHPDLVPFGADGGGDQFCLSVGPEDYGSVYYVAHEFYTPPKKKERKQPRQYGKSGVYFLAPSFTAFLDGLVEIPDA